jgi:hypothetical protein
MISPFELCTYSVNQTRFLNRTLIEKAIYGYFPEIKSFSIHKFRTTLIHSYDACKMSMNLKFFRAFGKDGVILDYRKGVYR